MTEQDVKKLLEIGECINIEFKESKESVNKDTYQTVCAFLNRIGEHITPNTLIPYTKNPKIARVFREIGRADELGSGVKNIFKYTPIYSKGGVPQFIEKDIFRIIIPLVPEAETLSGETTRKTMEKTVEKILSLIRENPKITMREIEESTGLSRRGVEWNIAKLKKEGKIKRVGPDKGGHWEVTE